MLFECRSFNNAGIIHFHSAFFRTHIPALESIVANKTAKQKGLQQGEKLPQMEKKGRGPMRPPIKRAIALAIAALLYTALLRRPCASGKSLRAFARALVSTADRAGFPIPCFLVSRSVRGLLPMFHNFLFLLTGGSSTTPSDVPPGDVSGHYHPELFSLRFHSPLRRWPVSWSIPLAKQPSAGVGRNAPASARLCIFARHGRGLH